MSGHCNECGNTQCVCAVNDPAWRIFAKRGEVARLEAENAKLQEALDGLDIDLALMANGNGSTKFKENLCMCDSSVGACPCQYCAIQDVLEKIKALQKGGTE